MHGLMKFMNNLRLDRRLVHNFYSKFVLNLKVDFSRGFARTRPYFTPLEVDFQNPFLGIDCVVKLYPDLSIDLNCAVIRSVKFSFYV